MEEYSEAIFNAIALTRRAHEACGFHLPSVILRLHIRRLRRLEKACKRYDDGELSETDSTASESSDRLASNGRVPRHARTLRPFSAERTPNQMSATTRGTAPHVIRGDPLPGKNHLQVNTLTKDGALHLSATGKECNRHAQVTGLAPLTKTSPGALHKSENNPSTHDNNKSILSRNAIAQLDRAGAVSLPTTRQAQP